jgi:LPS export ABC transporter permease LptF/LPS export ABC transporter permease LptG
MRVRLIDRYVCRELAAHALLGLAVFTFVFFVPQLVRLMDLVVRHWSNAGTVLLLIACALPGVLSFSLPIAVLVGALIGLGRLGSDSEIIALNAAGIGRRHLLVPVGILAGIAALLTLGNTVWLGPAALGELSHLEARLASSQTSIEIEPRVFQEEFRHLILYVEDASAAGTRWRGVFLAQTGGDDGTQITLARSAVLVPRQGEGTLQLHLEDGSTRTFDPSQPNHYTVATFGSSDLALRIGEATATAPRGEPSVPQQSTGQLLAASGPGWREARVELQRRFAFPVACLVFGLLAVGVGARPRQTGRAMGIVLTLVLLSGYYLLFVIGVGKARQGVLPPWAGVWLADMVGVALAIALLVGIDSVSSAGCKECVAEWIAALRGRRRAQAAAREPDGGANAARQAAVSIRPSRRWNARFPLLIDLYVLKSFSFYFLVTLVGFVLLIEVFTFFELLNDIARHHVGFAVVANYFRYLAPLLLYQLTPLAALIGTLAALAMMSKFNEVTAFKASGISLYRLSLPLLFAGLLLAGGLFAMDAGFLPYANQKQDALRNQIKGRPAQTFFQPRLRWIFGRGDKIYNYELFDADRDLFAGLNVFELDPSSFQLRRQVFAKRAHWEPELGAWVLEEGWVRDFRGAEVTHYEPFTADSFPELNEPPSYFLREVRQSYQMNWRELGQYIGQLKHAGFDVARLSVEWHRKFAFPLLAAIIVLIGIPFPFLVGTRGAVGGLAVGLGIGIVYWSASALFEAMGAVGQLPPGAAGWAPDAIFLFAGLYFFLKMPT